ncbi:unnamed protein product [Rangifer tarandus platyrhynchus]|uniref:Uncharacterized protein n=2 Tax=Rangifer tarandus platyrhynchus TaxID=3082113 RepID=A0ACB0F310_RANTA|nr:unnamed protein product [Rangifer tarandus platyrhynchus]CAI9706694.1 unnamed protein product [Rangifer tarandus platyrhynchus]
MLAARGSAASFSATGLGSQRQLDLAAAGAWGFLGNEFLEPFPWLFLSWADLSFTGTAMRLELREMEKPLKPQQQEQKAQPQGPPERTEKRSGCCRPELGCSL